MRTIAVATFSRADYSTCRPLLHEIQADPDLRLQLIVSGMHLSPDFGSTEREIEPDGFEITERIEMLLSSDTPEGTALSVGLAMVGFARSLARLRPDLLLLVGDRFELLAAASAALPFRIPVAHVSGGDITEGAVDNLVRDAVSKLSSLHFVAMQAHADRLIQMGEEPWRVFVTGDPALDEIRHMCFLTRQELEEHLGLPLTPPVLLVTFHPTTLGAASVAEEIDALLKALDRVDATLIFTSPVADPGARIVLDHIREFASRKSSSALFLNLGQLVHYSLMNKADLMVGNSSSGIWEAPSFELPVVNVGNRQKGRVRAANVIDTGADRDEILQAVQRGLSADFRNRLRGITNPYGDGAAAPRILSALKTIDLGPKLLTKSVAARLLSG